MSKDTSTDSGAALPLGRSLWAILPDAISSVVAALRGRARGEAQPAPAPASRAPRAARRRTGAASGGYVAVIPLTGLITPRGSFLSMLFGGGGGLVDFRDEFRAALASPEVQAIVIDVDSPGGYVDLVPETAQEIYDARGVKPIVAVANTMAASAAYWIASQADELVITPSGKVGSIGVYILHENWAGWNEKTGIDPTYVFAGAHKIEGNPDEPLSDEARQDWQQEVEDLHAMFVEAVARGRGVSTEVTAGETFGQGRTLLAQRAVDAGLGDRLDTLEAVVGQLLMPEVSGAEAARIGRAAGAVDEPPEPVEPPEPIEPEPEPEPIEPPPAAEITAAARREFIELFV